MSDTQRQMAKLATIYFNKKGRWIKENWFGQPWASASHWDFGSLFVKVYLATWTHLGDLASGLSSVCGLRDISYLPDREKFLLHIPKFLLVLTAFGSMIPAPIPWCCQHSQVTGLWRVPATAAQPAGTERRARFNLEIVTQGKNQSHFTCRTGDKYTHVYT